MGIILGSDTTTEEAEELSEFGAPKRFDGHFYPVHPLYVTSVKAMPADMWRVLLSSKALGWVVIPTERQFVETAG